MVISTLIKNAKHPLLTGQEDNTQSTMQVDLIGFELSFSLPPSFSLPSSLITLLMCVFYLFFQPPAQNPILWVTCLCYFTNELTSHSCWPYLSASLNISCHSKCLTLCNVSILQAKTQILPYLLSYHVIQYQAYYLEPTSQFMSVIIQGAFTIC